MGTIKTVSRPSALVRAEHGGAPAHLTSAERKVLDEAVRRGEDVREDLESKTLAYGRWLLEKVFDDDTTAALDDKSKNPIWQELVRRAGGPTLGITQHLLYVALRIAAHDHRIAATAWRNLDAGRKELLLPLGDERTMLTAAKHVSEMNLSQKKTAEYVSALRAKAGRARTVRLTPKSLHARIRSVRARLGDGGVVKRLTAMRAEMDPKDRDAMAAELAGLKDVVSDMLRALRR
ncbi:MAG TPA: hypothetical protein VGH28_02190 [Polyangiaceae bacterium]|jgi:hypothetical protein